MDKWYLNRGPLHKSLSRGIFVFGMICRPRTGKARRGATRRWFVDDAATTWSWLVTSRRPQLIQLAAALETKKHAKPRSSPTLLIYEWQRVRTVFFCFPEGGVPDIRLFIVHHARPTRANGFSKGHLALTLAPLIVWNLFKADSNFDRLSDCFLSWGTYCNCFYWYISFQKGKKVRVSLCIIVEPLGVKRVALTWVEILMCESVLSSLKDLSFIHFFNSWHGKVSLSCTVIHVILYPFPYEPSMNDN